MNTLHHALLCLMCLQAMPGWGRVVSGGVDYEALPSKARKFLQKYCDGHAITRCEKEFTSGDFNLMLADGIEMVFDSRVI